MSTQIIERMAVEIDGQPGDALIMIHGLGGTSNTFTPQMSVCQSRFRVIRPDLPGSGRSLVTGALSIQTFVDTIIRMADVLGLRCAHFAAHSMGTIVCQYIAMQKPRLVRSLVLFGPLLEPTTPAREGLKKRAAEARASGMGPIADAIVQAATSSDTKRNQPVTIALVREMIMRQDAEGYAKTCEALANAVAAEIDRIACPVLLMTGDEDVIAPASNARAMGERMAAARVTVFNRCGHWTTFERALDVNSALNQFYSGRV